MYTKTNTVRVVVRVHLETLKFHISGALTLRETPRKKFNKKKFYFFMVKSDNIEIFSNHVSNVHPCLLASYIWKSKKKYFFNSEK